MNAHEIAQETLDLLSVHDENVSREIAQAAEMLARHILAETTDGPLQVTVASDRLNKLIRIATHYEVLRDSRNRLAGLIAAFLIRWERSGPAGSAQWEKFDKRVQAFGAALDVIAREVG